MRVETYFEGEGRLAARRDWVITDVATGAQLCAATSTWVTINVANRRLSKLPDDMRRRLLRFAPPAPRHAVAPAEAKRKVPDLEPPPQYVGAVQARHDEDEVLHGGQVGEALVRAAPHADRVVGGDLLRALACLGILFFGGVGGARA